MLFAAGRRRCVMAGCNVDNGKPQTAIEITMRGLWLAGQAVRPSLDAFPLVFLIVG